MSQPPENDSPSAPLAQEVGAVQIPRPAKDFKVSVEDDPARGGFCIRVAPAGKGSPGAPPEPPALPASPDGSCAPPPYRNALWREEAFWELWHEGRHATLKHEQGLFYVAHALGHPTVSLRKLDLATRYAPPSRRNAGITEAWDSQAGKLVSLGAAPVVQAPVVREDDQEARRRLRKQAGKLEAVLAGATTSAAERAEASQQLQQIEDFLRRDHRLSRDEYKKAADSVRSALKHLLETLRKPGNSAASPPEVRRAFADHLDQYLMAPSSRYSAPKARRAAGEHAGCLRYEPPAGVRWSPCQVTALDDPEPFPGEQAANSGQRRRTPDRHR